MTVVSGVWEKGFFVSGKSFCGGAVFIAGRPEFFTTGSRARAAEGFRSSSPQRSGMIFLTKVVPFQVYRTCTVGVMFTSPWESQNRG